MKVSTVQSYSCYACHRSAPSRYPNSASRHYIRHKLLDIALAAAITVAVVAIMLFLIVLT